MDRIAIMGTLVCRVELNKTKGMILTVENGEDGITQTIVMDGTSITTSVEGADAQSVITQDQASISFKCKDFIIEAETVSCESTGKTNFISGGDFTLASQAGLNVTAAVDASYEAMNTAVKSTAKTVVQGGELELSGDISAGLNAPMLKVEADGMLDLSAGGIATLKGSAVNISGAVKMG